MGWTTPRTWVTGELVTAALMNTYISDDFAYLKASPTFDGNVTITGSLTVTGSPFTSRLCQGRLTLTTGVPVTTGDVTAAGTLYWTPYQGNLIALYSGSAWIVFAQAQLSIAVPAAATQCYDVFVDYNGGVPALSLTAWTSDTARATALTTQDGVLVLTGSTGKRYVGTVRTVTASQLNDSVALRHVWNYYHRVPRVMRVTEATNTWVYDDTTIRQANGNAANQLDCVVGVAEVELVAQVQALVINSAGAQVSVAIGADSTSAAATGCLGMREAAFATLYTGATAVLRTYPAVGRHIYPWLESGGGATTTWAGDNNTPTLAQAGITGTIWG